MLGAFKFFIGPVTVLHGAFDTVVLPGWTSVARPTPRPYIVGLPLGLMHGWLTIIHLRMFAVRPLVVVVLPLPFVVATGGARRVNNPRTPSPVFWSFREVCSAALWTCLLHT